MSGPAAKRPKKLKVFIGLGSNLGPREENLGKALTALAQIGVELVRISSVYESPPADLPEQPDFLNIVAEVATALSPDELLSAVLAIERELGRERTVPKGPRTIDIDILLYDAISTDTARLIIPHPRMTERSFVIVPLLEIAPGAVFPDGTPVRRALAGIDSGKAAIRKVGELVSLWSS